MQEIISFGIRLCEIIEYLHSLKPYPLLYMDFKPEHLLMSGDRLYLLDFGAAVTWDGKVKALAGTPGYIAPELFQGCDPSPRSDIYGMGRILEGVLQRRSQEDISEEENGPEVNQKCRLEEIVAAMVKADPADRPGSVTEVKELLSEIILQKLCEGKSNQKIAIVGSQHRIGTTHFALAYGNYLAERGQKALYLELGPPEVLEAISRYRRGFRNRGDLYSYHHFRGRPLYDGGIAADERGKGANGIQICDYGVYERCKRRDITECREIYVLLGQREWERESTEKLLAEFAYQSRVHWIFSGGSAEYVGSICRQYSIEAMLFPFDRDPFQMTDHKKAFFEALEKQRGTEC